MAQNGAPNSYLLRYQMKKNNQDSRSLNKSAVKVNNLSPNKTSGQANSIAQVISKLSDKVEGIEVKLTSLVNVVKLLQRYTETKDDQYQKQKQNLLTKKYGERIGDQHDERIQVRIRQFDLLTKQFKDQLKSIEKIKGKYLFDEVKHQDRGFKDSNDFNQGLYEDMQDRLRDEINKKMQICVKLINSSSLQITNSMDKGLTDKINELSFNLNQLEHECKRNRMIVEKQIDGITSLIKETSTNIPNNQSRMTEGQIHSRSPFKHKQLKSKSKNSKSDKSLSKGKQNKSAGIIIIPKEKQSTKIKEEELREALRKKKEHRQKLKVKNW